MGSTGQRLTEPVERHPPGSGAADLALIRRVQTGDRSAFDLLVVKYQHKILKLIMRYVRDPSEALDVAQEAFLKAYRAAPSFRGDSAFYTWLYRIAINTAKNHLVAAGRRPRPTTWTPKTPSRPNRSPICASSTPPRPSPSRRDPRHRKPRHPRLAGGATNRHFVARNRRPQLRGNRANHGVPRRHRALTNLSRTRSNRQRRSHRCFDHP